MYKCLFCDKENVNEGAKSMHQKHCHHNPNRTQYVPWTTGKVGTFKGKTHSAISKNNIAIAKFGNRNANHRGDRQSYYKDTRMDSRWEVGVARYLDGICSVWKYSEKGYKLSDGRYYYPDFFVYENDLLVKVIEVKGYFREGNQQKFNQFLLEYPSIPIELWMKDKLKELNIIDSSGNVKFVVLDT